MEGAGDLLALVRRAGRALARLPRSGAWAIALGWAALIWWVSSRSSLPTARLPGGVGGFVADLGHPAAFGLLALWLVPAVFEREGAWVRWSRRRALAVLLLAVGWGLADEAHQAGVVGRVASAWDLLGDATGATAVLATVAYAGRDDATRRGLARRLLLGLVACAAVAAVATVRGVERSGGSWFA